MSQDSDSKGAGDRTQGVLVDVSPTEARERGGHGRVRVEEPQRKQVEIRFDSADELLPVDHPARLFWGVLGMMDLARFTSANEAVEGHAGRSVKSPRMMLTLWLYAISQAVGSAREIARLIKTDSAYQWIVGNVVLGHHKLSSFRVGHGEAFNALMSDVLATLMEQGLVSLELVAQDGTRTRAAATAPSFRSKVALEACREQAVLHLKAVLAAADDPEYTRAQHARRETAARDYQARVEAAISTVNELQLQRTDSSKPARASTTDADARVMKMGDGGFRPAFNVITAVAGSPLGGPRTIVGVTITNIGSDMGMMAPMVDQIHERTGQYPAVLLADGGHASHNDISAVMQKGVDVIVPPQERAKPIDALPKSDVEVIAWRERMEEPSALKLYKARAGLCELANAHQKSHHGITQFLVRGIPKVTNVILLSAIASNILQHAKHILN